MWWSWGPGKCESSAWGRLTADHPPTRWPLHWILGASDIFTPVDDYTILGEMPRGITIYPEEALLVKAPNNALAHSLAERVDVKMSKLRTARYYTGYREREDKMCASLKLLMLLNYSHGPGSRRYHGRSLPTYSKIQLILLLSRATFRATFYCV